jgi:hypothetical protein
LKVVSPYGSCTSRVTRSRAQRDRVPPAGGGDAVLSGILGQVIAEIDGGGPVLAAQRLGSCHRDARGEHTVAARCCGSWTRMSGKSASTVVRRELVEQVLWAYGLAVGVWEYQARVDPAGTRRRCAGSVSPATTTFRFGVAELSVDRFAGRCSKRSSRTCSGPIRCASQSDHHAKARLLGGGVSRQPRELQVNAVQHDLLRRWVRRSWIPAPYKPDPPSCARTGLLGGAGGAVGCARRRSVAVLGGRRACCRGCWVGERVQPSRPT